MNCGMAATVPDIRDLVEFLNESAIEPSFRFDSLPNFKRPEGTVTAEPLDVPPIDSRTDPRI